MIHVSTGPPIIPESRISQVRFEVAAAPHVPVRGPLTGCALGSLGESWQFGPPAAGPQDLPDVISANLSLDA